MTTTLSIAVIRGGSSAEHDVSLKTGRAIIDNLSPQKYTVRDIVITKNEEWEINGTAQSMQEALFGVDVAFVALHGEYGEDGQVQKILEDHNIAYTGSGVAGSAIALDKVKTRNAVAHIDGITMPYHRAVSRGEAVDPAVIAEIQVSGASQYIVKPLTGGSSIGIALAKTPAELPQAIQQVFDSAKVHAVIVESFIAGREGTCGVLEDFNGEQLSALPPIEIRVAQQGGFWDYTAKYDGKTEEICPGNFTEEETKTLQRLAKEVHTALGLRHYSRSDFIIADEGIYFLEVNTLPGLTPTSLLPKSIAAADMSFPDFLDHLVMLAQKSAV